MKNFKKIIFLSIFVIIVVIYLVYSYAKDNSNEIIEEDVYTETNTNIEKSNKIILHITGEVKSPRNYRN